MARDRMEECMNGRFGGAEGLSHQHHQHQNEQYYSNMPASSGSGEGKVKSNSGGEEEEDEMGAAMMIVDLRRGPWTVEEDHTLMSYIAKHGEGCWNSLARCAGLKRTGKSCRLRWLNYLRPNVRRGNITLEEQLLILELHSLWGNRWSKIAQHFPGRTDNEIKNYWRTRVQKHAKQLKCDVNSKQFKDTKRYLWMPRLAERIQAAAATGSSPLQNPHTSLNFTTHQIPQPSITTTAIPSYGYSENSSTTGASSDSFNAQVSPFSDVAENHHQSYNLSDEYLTGYSDSLVSPAGYYTPQTAGFRSVEHKNYITSNNNYDNLNDWVADGGGDLGDKMWNVEDVWLLQQQHFSNNC